MTTPSKTLTLWDADGMIDEAQTKIAGILADLANATGLQIGPIELVPWSNDSVTGFNVRIWATMPHSKG
jgi:hypothetical protein